MSGDGKEASSVQNEVLESSEENTEILEKSDEVLDSRPTQLYRHFDANGGLLYVGISLSAIARLGQHRDYSHWFFKIARVEIERFETRSEAVAAERKAILSERPAHNIAHKKDISQENTLAWRAQQSRESLVSQVIDYRVMYKFSELQDVLQFPRSKILEFMEKGQLQYLGFMHKRGYEIRYVTGWQLIDFVEWLHTDAGQAAIVGRAA